VARSLNDVFRDGHLVGCAMNEQHVLIQSSTL